MIRPAANPVGDPVVGGSANFPSVAETYDVSDEPLLGVRREADGTYEVNFGGIEGPLAGSGTTVTVDRDADGFKAVSASFWTL